MNFHCRGKISLFPTPACPSQADLIPGWQEGGLGSRRLLEATDGRTAHACLPDALVRSQFVSQLENHKHFGHAFEASTTRPVRGLTRKVLIHAACSDSAPLIDRMPLYAGRAYSRSFLPRIPSCSRISGEPGEKQGLTARGCRIPS